ncbi:MAG: AraC family transcriptional regulator [bacterium]|nr:AraC family transcriptional regulator [bacterium]
MHFSAETLERTRFERRLLGLLSSAGAWPVPVDPEALSGSARTAGLHLPAKIGTGYIRALRLRPGLEALAIDCRGGAGDFRCAWRADRNLNLLGISLEGQARLTVNGAQLPDLAAAAWSAQIEKGARVEWHLPAAGGLRELIYCSGEWRDFVPAASRAEQPRIALLIERLFEMIAAPGPEPEALALLAYAWLGDTPAPGYDSLPGAVSGLPPAEMRKIYQARAIVRQEYLAPPTTVRLAQRVALNEYKLKRGYRQVFGDSIHADLRRYRMQLARDLLLAGESSVAAVACAVGYSNPGHFARAFRQEFGLAPGSITRSQRTFGRAYILDSDSENESQSHL